MRSAAEASCRLAEVAVGAGCSRRAGLRADAGADRTDVDAQQASSALPAVDARARRLRRAPPRGVARRPGVRRAGPLRVRARAEGPEIALRAARPDLRARTGDGRLQPLAGRPLPARGSGLARKRVALLDACLIPT